ncbi:MAG: cobalamin-independent methionine synthase II family protein [bacterium]
MIKATKDMPLATTITGSLPRPSWYTANLAGRPFRLAMADSVFREQYNDAVSCFIRDQERAGLDVLTDGDCRFDTDVGGRSWVTYPAQRIGGMTGYEHSLRHATWGGAKPGELLYEVLEARMLPIVTDKVSRGPLEYPALWKTAQKMTQRPVKFGTITAECIESTCGNEYYKDRRELIMDLAAVINEEVLDLAKAGCPIVQMEEPWVHRLEHHEADRGIGIDFYVEAFNRSVRGLEGLTEVWCHTCWGSPSAQRFYDEGGQRYGRSLEKLNELDADVITFEAASSPEWEFEAIGKVLTEKKIAIGVVSHRALQIETPKQIAHMLREALKHIPAERLILSSDCGFGREGMSRRHAFYKMAAIVRGGNIVRRELGIPEAVCLAEDPRFLLVDAD